MITGGEDATVGDPVAPAHEVAFNATAAARRALGDDDPALAARLMRDVAAHVRTDFEGDEGLQHALATTLERRAEAYDALPGAIDTQGDPNADQIVDQTYAHARAANLLNAAWQLYQHTGVEGLDESAAAEIEEIAVESLVQATAMIVSPKNFLALP